MESKQDKGMVFVIRRRRRRCSVKRTNAQHKHYLKHKEAARALVLERLAHFNQYYGFCYGRVSIKAQRRCWGSCSSLSNLNFNYRILFLPPDLQDYIVVHELCHLEELNHGPAFWALVEKTIPDYKQKIALLKLHERGKHY